MLPNNKPATATTTVVSAGDGTNSGEHNRADCKQYSQCQFANHYLALAD